MSMSMYLSYLAGLNFLSNFSKRVGLQVALTEGEKKHYLLDCSTTKTQHTNLKSIINIDIQAYNT